MAAKNYTPGTCLCGAVKVTVSGEPEFQVVCHCTDCRGWFGSCNFGCIFKVAAVKVEGELISYNVTQHRGQEGGWARKCCKKCGSCITSTHEGLGLDDVAAGIICGPGENDRKFKPQYHLYYGERIFSVPDGLPKFKNYPKELGGDDVTVPE